jgi:HPt (histidine-containing phosphotransfer) domain-containing protein
MDRLESAARAGDGPELQRVAHSCAGASATCGMGVIVPFLRELERQGTEEKLTSAKELAQKVTEEFVRIRAFLENYLKKQTAAVARP